MTPPLVSIIVNNCNYARFVGQAIRSALDQTWPHTEVLVVDDGSTDDSRAVIEPFGTAITTVFKENGGQASAFNAGFACCRGQIVVFLDADDLLLPNAVERAVSLFNNTTVVKVHWPLWRIDEDGRRLGGVHTRNLVSGDFREHFIAHGPVSLPQSPTSGNAWSRRFLQAVFPLPEHADKHGADGFLRKLAPIHGTIARLEQPAGCYRIHAGGYGGARSEMFKLRRGYQRYPAYCALLAEHLRRQGATPDAASWMKEGSYYAWLRDAVTLDDELSKRIPAGSRVILIDTGMFGDGFLAGCSVVPFLERDGDYWGPPADDRQAIDELERQRKGGAQILVLAFPAFWWLDTYPQFIRQVRAAYACTSSDARALVFDLGSNAGDCHSSAQNNPRTVEAAP